MITRTISHFEILEKLGEGGMGVVWKARDTRLDRLVALKVLPADKVANPERERRFVQEARAASALNHPNIVTVHEISSEDGITFMVMEYLPGKTLDQLIPRKGLRTAETLKHAIQIADALSKAHAAGIVHRDLKPGNVMVTVDGRVKVLDFGLAKLTEAPDMSGDEATRTMRPDTGEGTIVGTVSYMSPEQAEGKKVDARSDIFAFGAVLYEMVTGQRAFQGDSKVSTLASILNKEPKPVSEVAEDVPQDLQKIIARCLRKDPDRRFQHTADLKVALLDLREESDSGTAALAAAASSNRPRRPWIWIAALAGLAVLVAVACFVILRSKTEEAAPVMRPLTSYPGSESEASFSPDGNQVAFSWDGEKQDNYDIYVKLVDSGPSLRLTTDPAEDRHPAWSPDGRQIAFLRSSDDRLEILLISPLGGAERKLAEVAVEGVLVRGLSWSPDGKFLAVRDRNSIALVSTQSGEKREFTSPPRGTFGDYSPEFSPDGQTLAFARSKTPPPGDILLAPISNGLEVRELTRDNRVILGLAWTPDGKEIVFSSRRGGDPTLWRIPVLGGAPERLSATGPDSLFPAIARRGRRAAFTRFNVNSGIWRLDLNPAGPPASPTRLIASTRRDSAPRISPDGRRIAFVSDRSGSREMWVCDSQGANAVQLTSFGGGLGDPAWSPDGSRIAFIARPENRSDVFVIGGGGGCRASSPPGRSARTTQPGRGMGAGFILGPTVAARARSGRYRPREAKQSS